MLAVVMRLDVLRPLAGYRGRALSMDSDMQVFADLAELWWIPFGSNGLLCSVQDETPERWRNDKSNFHPGRHFAVMLLDGSRFDWAADEIVRGLDELRYSYKELLTEMCVVPHDEIGETIPPEWNSLEKYEPGVTKNVHSTVIGTQPWHYPGKQIEPVWWQADREAVESGAIAHDTVASAVGRRFRRLELLDLFDAGCMAREKLGYRVSVVATSSAISVRRTLFGRTY